jgi:hypothetical protein
MFEKQDDIERNETEDEQANNHDQGDRSNSTDGQTTVDNQSDRDCRIGGKVTLSKGVEVTLMVCDDYVDASVSLFNQGASLRITEDDSESSVKLPMPGNTLEGALIGHVTVTVEGDLDDYTVTVTVEYCQYRLPPWGGWECHTESETVDISDA